MYLGRVVEQGRSTTIFHAPEASVHAGAAALDPEHRGRAAHAAADDQRLDPASRTTGRTGCPFHPRCPDFMPGICDRHEPRLLPLGARPRGELLPLPADRPADGRGRLTMATDRPRGRSSCRSTSRSAAACCARWSGSVRAVDDVSFRHPPGRDAGAGRRERLRQDHDRALHPARARRRPAGAILFRTQDGASVDVADAAAAAAAAAAAPDADDLPGPVLLAQPAHDGRSTSSASRCWSTASRNAQRAARPGRASCSTWSGCRPRVHAPLPARLQRRPAPAHRHRARAGAEPARWSSPTSRSRRSTSRSRRRSSTCCSTCRSGSA